MKELSIEQKTQRYNEALKRAMRLYEQGTITESLSYVFPELKESEDERIKEAIIATIHLYYGEPLEDEAKEMIAWLEKQGESTDINPSEFDLRLNKLLKQFETLSKEELTSSLSFYLNVIQNDGTYREEKQGEQKPSMEGTFVNVDEVREDFMQEVYRILDADTTNDRANQIIDVFDNLPTIAIQKPVDKVEPKFHEGDWIVYECGEETATLQITRIVGETYVFSDNSTLGVVDEDALRLWDITKDAKDGDVLHSPSHRLVWIYKDNEHYHVCINMNYITENIAIDGLIKIPSDVCPATSVQRAILFSKMEGAGYEWDTEHKQLKKIETMDKYEGLTDFERTLTDICIGWIGEEIGWKQYIKDNADVLLKIAVEKFNSVQDAPFEQKPTDNDMKELLHTEYEKGRADAIAEMQKPVDCTDCTNSKGCINCEDGNMKETLVQKTAWSEEDECYMSECIGAIATKDGWSFEEKRKTKHWLKSLKERCTWKPSDEQIKALHDLNLTGNISYAGQGQVLIELYNDLKKLAEE